MQQVANQQEAAEPADNSAATEAARTAQQATQAAQTVQSVTGELAALDGEYETLLEEVRRVSRWDGGRGWVGLSWVTQLCVCVRVCTWRLQLKQQSEADASTLAAKQSLERARQKQSLEVRTHHHVLLLCRTSPNPLRASQARRQRALERRAAAKRRLAEAQAAEEAARLLREELGQTEVSGDEVALAEQVSEAASAVTAANMEVDDIDLDLTAVIDAVCDSCCRLPCAHAHVPLQGLTLRLWPPCDLCCRSSGRASERPLRSRPSSRRSGLASAPGSRSVAPRFRLDVLLPNAV